MGEHELRQRQPARPSPRQPAMLAPGPRGDRLAQLASAINARPGGPVRSAAQALTQRAANRTGLPDQLRQGIEGLSGMSMDHVRVHFNSPAPARLNAHAYAQGSDIHVAPGEESHLPHEAWHVVQQARGRVRATAQLKGAVPINDDSALEHEADRMGAAALRAVPVQAVLNPAARHEGPVQRRLIIAGNDIADEESVQQFLTAHQVHFYHSYAELSRQLIDDHAVHRYGPGEAARLGADLGARWATLDQSGGEEPPAGAQAAIQRKLVEIAELFRTTLEGAGPIPENYHTWYRDFILNGLCLGFVKVFEQHPDWMMGLWHALQDWHPPHGVPPGEILADLNHHIEQAMAFADDREGENFLEAVLLAREAWNGMNEPGGEEGEHADHYDLPPKEIEAVEGTPSDHISEKLRQEDDETWQASAVEAPQRWPTVEHYILGQVGNKPGTYHIIIYHEGHEMAVRYVNRGAGDATLIAVETEEQGLTRCSDWAQVGVIIGAQLAHATDAFGVDIREQRPLPRGGGLG